jgi:hypothetical protein
MPIEMNAPMPDSAQPSRKVHWMPRGIAVGPRADGCMVRCSRVPLLPSAPHIPHYLRQWVAGRPQHTWLAGAEDIQTALNRVGEAP